MKQGIRFLFLLFVSIVVPASPCPGGRCNSCVTVIPKCGTHLLIIDYRDGGDPITEAWLGEKEPKKLDDPVSREETGPGKAYMVALPGDVGGTALLTLKSTKEIIFQDTVVTRPYDPGPPEPSPRIGSVSPRMARAGSILTVTGKNFGTNSDNLTLYINNYTPITASWVSDPKNATEQRAQFILPMTKQNGDTKSDVPQKENTDNPLYNFGTYKSDVNMFLEVVSDKHILRSNWTTTGIAKANISSYIMIFSITFIIVILLFVYFIVYFMTRQNLNTKHVAFIDICTTLLADKKTNTLSLSKFQAFFWTIAIVWSYVYLTAGRMILLCDFSIPELSPSLLGLLGISYTGLIAARGLGNSHPKNDLATTEQKISDLFSENNEISLPRLQLFIFTFVGIAVYVFNCINPEFFNKGLPEIPDTLNGLFLVSQGGYIGGKLTGATVVNYLLPRRITPTFTGDITIVGRGFADNTKVLLQGTQTPIPTTFLNQNTLTFKPPTTPAPAVGLKQIVLIPPTGTSFVVDNALEIIDVTTKHSVKDKILQVDFSGIVLSGESLAAHLGGTPLSIRHKEGNSYNITRPEGFSPGDAISIAAMDGSFETSFTVIIPSPKGASGGQPPAPGAAATEGGAASDRQEGASGEQPPAPGTPAPGDG